MLKREQMDLVHNIQTSQPQQLPRPLEKVELAKSDNAWKRLSEVTEGMSDAEKDTTVLYGKFLSILNKLTPQKFQKLAEQARELAEKMNTQERMDGCVEKLFHKALKEPLYSVAYAKLSLVLTPYKVTIVGEDGQPKQMSFRALLLTKCQQEFEKDKKEDEHLEQLKAVVEAAETEEEKKQRKAEYEAEEFESRHRSLGNIRFIGELFKFKLLSEAIVHELIQRLLKSLTDEESLECFAKLMTTIGKELDHDKGQKLMERYFNRVAHIIEVNRIGSRVKFMLQDVVDLRKNNWVPRRIAAVNVPTTIDRIHADHHQQAKEMKRMLAMQLSRPCPPPRREEWSTTESRRPQQQIQPEKLDLHRLRRLHKQNVHPTESENSWKRLSEVTEGMSGAEDTTELYGKFQSILNKLTPQNFQKLAEQAKELAEKMNTQERMSCCIEKIFLKALEEPVFCDTYAKLCLVLTPCKVTIVGEDGQPKQKSFRALLLIKCGQEFEKDKKEDEHLEQLKAAVEAAETEEEKGQRETEYEVEAFKSQRRSLGTIRFIGELFKFKLLSEAVVHECIQRLLKSLSDEESLECFAKLMTTIGKELDHDKGQNLMERYFARVAYIIEVNRIGSRVKFMLQDVVDLRKNNWVPRKIVAANVPTTIDKIHADHHQQAEEMKRMLAAHPSRPHPPPGDSRRREDWTTTDSRRPQQQIQPEKIESDRLKRLHKPADTSGLKRLGPSAWSKPQKPIPEPPPKTDSAKYGGRSSKGKKSTGPATSGQRRPAAQLSASDVKKKQKDVIAAVALQTDYKLLMTPVVSDALSEEEVEKKSESVYAELCSNLDYKEAQLCVSEMRSPGKLHKLVFSVLNASMEKSPKCRQTASIFFDQLLKEGLLSHESLLKGLNELLEFTEDLECDLPKFWDYIAEVIVHPVSSGRLPLAELKKAHEGVLQSGKIGKLVAKTLSKCTALESISQDRVSRIWSESGLDWTTHLRVEPDDVKYLIEDHSLQFLLHSSPPTIQIHSGSSHDKQQEWMPRLQHKLSSPNDTNDDLVSFIEKNHSQECRSPSFVFSLSCSLGSASIRGSGDSAIYDSELFKRRCPLLKHFVDNDDCLQEEVIYGLQVTLSRKHHPKDVLDNLFTVLYENDVVGEEVFVKWEERGREDLEGRGVATMSVKSFMTWLKSADAENEDGQ